MRNRKPSPISAERLAQCRRKFRIRLRLAVPAALAELRFLPFIEYLC